MTENRYELVVGLETHVELKTRTKAFCGCENRYGAPPNTLVCPVCMGLPGALPVLGDQTRRLAVTAGLALGCDGLRVGLEDNIMMSKGVLATNAQLVERAVEISKLAGREIATAAEAREILGITRKSW